MFTKLEDTRYMQYVSAIIATLSMASATTYSTWPSPSLSKLQSNDSSPVDRPVTDDEGSWIVGSGGLGIVIGAALGGWVVEILGRKRMLLMTGVFLFVPWFMIIFGTHIVWIYVGRSISGLGGGMVIIGCAIYNGEIAENDIRGKLSTSFVVLRLVGSLIVLSIGPYVSYQALGMICAIIPVLFFVLFMFMPETPYYLMKIGEEVKAEKNLRILSKQTANDKVIKNRLSEIKNSIQGDMENKTTLWEFLTNKEYRKIIFVMTGIKILQQLCGVEAINSYMQPIIEMTGSNISPEVSSIIFGVIQLPAALVSTFLVDKIGRRPLLIISALGCAIALFGEGTYFYLQDISQTDVSSLGWLPTTGISLFLIMNPVGVQTLPYVLLGELFPANIKGIAVSCATVFGSSIAFLVAKFFMPLSNAWGVHTVFWIFGSICFCGSIFVLIFLPETKGKSFSEIQNMMRNPVNRNAER